MKIKIIYDNTAYDKRLEPDWGFAALIEVLEEKESTEKESKDTNIYNSVNKLDLSVVYEVKNKRILFDTGTKGSILLNNMKKMEINPENIDEVFISHSHYDHTGGLSSFLEKNNNVKLILPPSFRGLHNNPAVNYISEPTALSKNIYSTGELNNIEQSLIVKADKGLVVIVGCAHSKIENILRVAKDVGDPYAIIGGFHGFKKFEILEKLQKICPTHCTQHIEKIKKLYPEKYIEGGAGRIIEI